MFKLIFGIILFGVTGTANAHGTNEKLICLDGIVSYSNGQSEKVGFFAFAPSNLDTSIYLAHFSTNGGRKSNYFRGSFSSFLKNPSVDTELSAQTTFADSVNGVPYKTYEVSLSVIKTTVGNYTVTYTEHVVEKNLTYSTKLDFSAGSCSWN